MNGFTDQELEEFAEKRKRSAERLNQAIEDARRIGEILNEVHGTEFSDEFWQFLVLPHVRKLQVKEYQATLSRELDTTGKSDSLGTKPNGLRQKLGAARSQTASAVRRVQQRKSFANLRQALKVSDVLVFGFHDAAEIRNKGQLVSAAIPAMFPRSERNKRAQLKLYAEGVGNERLCQAIQTLPPLLVEQFQDLLARIPLHRPEHKQFHVSIGVEGFMSLLLALYRERGAEVHRYQHGSHYGEQENFGALERLTSTSFHTWGWKISNRDVPDKAYRLAGFKRRYQSKGETSESDILVCYPALHRNILAQVRQDSNELLDQIDRSSYGRIIARPRPMTRYADHSADIAFVQQHGIHVENGRADIAHLTASTRLVVHLRVPSTTFLECLYVDHPVMGVFFNHCPTELAMPHYLALFELGLMHRNGRSVARYLNQIESIGSWWRTVTSDFRYQSFKDTFARAA